ncbi:MAG: FeoB-associated Cys-rich membrane protein [Clostridia bacterium]|nr:FeoB-associated Cys-rich membrane protein [Clostridia bacterium]
MLALLQANLPTILIIAGLILFFGLLMYSLIRDKKKGKSSCCGGCAGCAMAGKCHPQGNTTANATPENTHTHRSDET